MNAHQRRTQERRDSRAWEVLRPRLGRMTPEQEAAALKLMLVARVKPRPWRSGTPHKIGGFTRVFNIVVRPNEENNFEGELRRITEKPDGTRTETRHSLKGLKG